MGEKMSHRLQKSKFVWYGDERERRAYLEVIKYVHDKSDLEWGSNIKRLAANNGQYWHLIASDLGWELAIRSKHCRQTVCEHGNNFGWCSWESLEKGLIHVEQVRKCSVKSLALILMVSTNVEPMLSSFSIHCGRSFVLVSHLKLNREYIRIDAYVVIYIYIHDQHQSTLMHDPTRPIKKKDKINWRQGQV